MSKGQNIQDPFLNTLERSEFRFRFFWLMELNFRDKLIRLTNLLLC